MSLLETAYSEVQDSARDFRVLLSAMSRPGAIHEFGSMPIQPPVGLSPASAAIALALLGTETSFVAVGLPEPAVDYIAANTRCRQTGIESADFHFYSSATSFEMELASAKRGSLNYPDQSATVVAQVTGLSSSPIPEAIRVLARGPGIEGSAIFYATGIHPVWLATLRNNNSEYPLGIDAIFTCGTRVLCLPRSVQFNWE